jgi:hypothetical protein
MYRADRISERRSISGVFTLVLRARIAALPFAHSKSLAMAFLYSSYRGIDAVHAQACICTEPGTACSRPKQGRMQRDTAVRPDARSRTSWPLADHQNWFGLKCSQ